MRSGNNTAQRPLSTWVSAAVFLVALVIWELLVRLGQIPPLFFPAPSAILSTLLRLLSTGELARHVRATLWRVSLGAVVGASAGYISGLSMGWSRPLRALLDPFLSAIHPLPKIALLPLIMIVFGLGESSKIVAIAVSAFFPMWINTLTGVLQMHPVYFEVAHNYGASVRRLFTGVIVPGSLPWVLTGLRLALNTALLIAIAVELTTAREGLGQLIWFAWQTLRTDELYATLVVIGLMGMAFNRLLEWLMRRLVHWQTEREAQ